MIITVQGANGSVIDLSDIVTTLTNSVISRVAMGRRFEHSKIKHLLDRFLDLVGRFSFATYIPSLGWIDILTGFDRKTNELIKEVDEFCEDVIREHENKKQFGDEDQDLVDILLEILIDNSSGYHLEKDVMKVVLFVIYIYIYMYIYIYIYLSISIHICRLCLVSSLVLDRLDQGA
ncbi:putative cytochrome P450 [Helianthus anomalus]